MGVYTVAKKNSSYMLSKMKTKQVQSSTQLVAVCVESGEAWDVSVYLCTHHTCGVLMYSESIFERIHRKLVILVVFGKRDDKG